MSGASAVQKQLLADVLQHSVRSATLLKRGFNTDVFLWNLRNLSEHLFLQNTSTLLTVNNVNQWRHALKVHPADKPNDIPEWYF